jgi:phage protein D
MKVMQCEAKHDLAVVTVRDEDPNVPEYTTGTACQLIYGFSPHQLETFYGYINHVSQPYERTTNLNQSLVYMDVVCVSASWILKQAFSRIWTSIQASAVVTEVAKSAMFSTTIETTDFSWPQLANPGRSAWSFLGELAGKLGWSLACNNTNLRFMSHDRVLSREAGTMPTFYSRTAAPNLNYETITRFESLQGETVQLEGHERTKRVLSNVDLTSGQVFTVNNTGVSQGLGTTRLAPFFTEYETDLVAADQQHAQARLDAEAQRNRFHIQASANVSGNSEVKQGTGVVLLGLGSKNSGVWYVEEVVHNLKLGKYTMDLTLGRDALGDTGHRSRPSGIAWQVTDRVGLPSTPPSTVFVNGQWRASWQGTRAA